jgi:hypothetical protein
LNSVTVDSPGVVHLHVTYTNNTSDNLDVVFDPPDRLTNTDNSNFADEYSDVGGSGKIAILPVSR